MKRPVPVVLTAIFLGFLAALQILLTVVMMMTGFLALHKRLPASSTPAPFQPSFLPILAFAMSVFLAAFAAWSILTLIGLVRLRSWARYSVLVMAGLMAGFGGISMVVSFAMPFLMPAMPTAADQPAPGPGTLHAIFFVAGAIYGIFTAIGAVLLVYFNLAKTRTLFLWSSPDVSGPPNTSTGRARPTAITVIGWIYLISSPFCLLYTFLPRPAFLFGFILYGLAARCMYLFFDLLTFAIGYGLLRLRNEARLGVFALFAFCPIQMVVLLTPWGARQFRICMDALNSQMYVWRYAPPNFFASPGAIIFFTAVGMAAYGVVLWFLHRHREAFTPLPPPPPMPPQSEAPAE